MGKKEEINYSIRIDRTILRSAKSCADKNRWTLGKLILIALKYLSTKVTDEGNLDIQDVLPENRNPKNTSFKYPKGEQVFIDRMKEIEGCSFSKIVELALFYFVPSLKKKITESNKGDSKIYKYRCPKCFELTILTDELQPKGKVRCPNCRVRALPESYFDNRYSNVKLKELLKYIQYGGPDIPKVKGIEIIDAEVIKRFFVGILREANQKASLLKKLRKKDVFIPLLKGVHPEWYGNGEDYVFVSYDQDGIYKGVIESRRKKKVFINLEPRNKREKKEKRKEPDKYEDHFFIGKKITNAGGLILGKEA